MRGAPSLKFLLYHGFNSLRKHRPANLNNRDESATKCVKLMLQAPAARKGRSTRMSNRIELSTAPQTDEARNACARTQVSAASSSGTRTLRAFGFLALAITIAVSGFGYRLSRYSLHPHVASRALLLKFWDKHQDTAQVTGIAAASAHVRLLPQGHAAHVTVREGFSLRDCASCAPAECERIPTCFLTDAPSRSPPSSISMA